ncbi:MAG: hypothetical protein M3069_10670 [Chloroflexota bacterium]|nr:hypothetical protein [Chloroflexota bacterium]
MELALALVALLAAVAALGFVFSLRSQVAQMPRVDPQHGAEIEGLKQELADLRRDLDHSQRELEELKSVTQMPPAPPLPRARSVGLTDLREQLRAAHREPEPPSEE